MLYRATEHAFERFLASQRQLAFVAVDDPFAKVRSLYRQELSGVRGLSNETVKQHDRTIDDFLSCTISIGQNLSSQEGFDAALNIGN